MKVYLNERNLKDFESLLFRIELNNPLDITKIEAVIFETLDTYTYELTQLNNYKYVYITC